MQPYSVMVLFFTLPRPAVSGMDFQPLSIMLTFGPNESKKTVTVSVLDDSILEGSERFFVDLSLDPSVPEGAVLGSDSRAVVTVVDNDGQCQTQCNAS